MQFINSLLVIFFLACYISVICNAFVPISSRVYIVSYFVKFFSAASVLFYFSVVMVTSPYQLLALYLRMPLWH